MIDRRQWIAGAGLASLSLLAGRAGARRAPAPFFARHHLLPGVQLYTVAPDLARDYDGTLERLSALGFRTVELAGFQGRSATQLRASFHRAGLRCTSAHVPVKPTGSDPGLDGGLDLLARDMHAIGVTDVVLPFPPLSPPPRSTADLTRIALDDWRRIAAYLNARATGLHQRGLRLGYHNHNFEFAPHDGGTGLDVLLRETDPRLVSFELDVGWAAAAGIDPVALLRAHPGRFTQLHVKDIKASTATNYEMRQDPVEVGGGTIDWPAILPAAYAAGVRRFYVEQEPPFGGPRLDAIAKSAAYLLAVKTA